MSNDVSKDDTQNNTGGNDLADNQSSPRDETLLLEAEKANNKNRSIRWLPVIILWSLQLTFIGIIAVGGWWAWTEWQNIQSQFERQQQAVSSLTEEMEHQLNLAEQAQQKRVQQLAQIANQQKQQIDSLKQDLIATARRFTESQGVTRYEWLLAEAEYLLRLAQQRLKIERDAPGALAILQSADAVLRDTKDLGLLDVREALAREMAAVAAVPQVDVAGTYLALAVISEDIHAWQPVVEYQAVAETSGQQPKWYERMADYVRVQRVTVADARPIGPDQMQQLKDLVRLKIEQAQAALLRGQEQSFQAALNQSVSWLKEYNGHQAQSQEFAERLNQVSQVQLSSQMPELGQSLKLLKGYIAQVYALQRSAPAEQTPQTEGQ